MAYYKLPSKSEISSTCESESERKSKNLDKIFRINGLCCTLKKLKTKVVFRLTDADLSRGLDYLYKKATKEILKFDKDVDKIGVLKDDILYCRSRILEGQNLKAVGVLSESIDIESFTGIKFCVPLISKHSPLAVSMALHLHYNVVQHRGTETVYRLSLQHARILGGKQLFKEVSDDCVYCKRLRLKYVKQLMGPLADTQLTISPIFYFTYLDMWGPITVYCPGYEKVTRNRRQAYQVYMLVMGCASTGTINCQIIEKKDTGAVLDGLNRFFSETCVPKICYPDQDGALMRALKHGEVCLVDLQGSLHRQRGIMFETCLPQGHFAHGRIERRIRMIQESLDRSDIKSTRCTATGWQTICKAIEREINGVPIGFLHHQGTVDPLLRILCPSLLKNGTFSDRAPKGLFTIPNSEEDLMTKIESIYNMWFKVWNVAYVPLIMDRQKWHIEGENLTKNDLVYFKLTDSPMAADWRFGKVEYADVGRDGLVRGVGISYKNKDGDNEEDWRHSVVERPARACVKLMNIEDTSILDNMRKVRKLAEEILGKVESDASTDGPIADDVHKHYRSRKFSKKIDKVSHHDEEDSQGVPHVNRKEISEVDETVKTKLSKKRKKKKTEIEKLRIENKEFDKVLNKPRETRSRKSILSSPAVWNNKDFILCASRSYSDLTLQIKSPDILQTPMYSVSSKNSEVLWPAMQIDEQDIGGVTAALSANVTALIAKGSQIRRLGWGEAVGKKGAEAELFNNNCDDVYLLKNAYFHVTIPLFHIIIVIDMAILKNKTKNEVSLKR